MHTGKRPCKTKDTYWGDLSVGPQTLRYYLQTTRNEERAMGRISPGHSLDETTFANTLTLTVSLQNFEIVYLHCLSYIICGALLW